MVPRRIDLVLIYMYALSQHEYSSQTYSVSYKKSNLNFENVEMVSHRT